MSQRVLLVHRYFWPDVPPYAQMLRFIGARLAADGHAVDVFCGPSTYNDAYAGPDRPDALAGIRVHRMRLPGDDKTRPVLRAASLVVFALRLVVHVLRNRRRYDLLTVTTIPPVIMGVAARVIKRLTGIPFVYHCMDLYPEVAEVAGLSRNRLLLRLARRLDTTTCRRAAAVVVLSQDMRATLLARGLADANIVVCNNFDLLDEADDPPEDVLPVDPDRFRITFAGNLGRFQGLEDVVDAATALVPSGPTSTSSSSGPACSPTRCGSGPARCSAGRCTSSASSRSRPPRWPWRTRSSPSCRCVPACTGSHTRARR